MKWITKNTIQYKQNMKLNWHKWFAWFPVTVKQYADGSVKKVWLEYVMRKGFTEVTGGAYGWEKNWYYQYKEIEKEDENASV